MKRVLFTPEEVNGLIAQGKRLILAGDEQALRRLSPGPWIAGSIPYFMAETGGLACRDRIFVTQVPDAATAATIRTYSAQSVAQVYRDIPENGFAVIIMPASSPTHLGFAVDAPRYQAFAARPLIGWVAGIHLNDLGKAAPKVFSGPDRQAMGDAAVVMHVQLPPHHYAEINIINLFQQGEGDTILFPQDGFCVTEALINGERRNFAEYVQTRKLDTSLPLVANYCGAMINISFQTVDPAARQVHFYAPVFQGIPYRQAAPIGDYVERVNRTLPEADRIFFSCNCILNYVYGALEGKQTGEITGPITFGEVAYQLLNQTLAYLVIGDTRP